MKMTENNDTAEIDNQSTVAYATFADVIKTLKAKTDVPATARRDMISALRRIDKKIGHGDLLTPAIPHLLQQRLSKLTPAAFGFSSKQSLANLKANLRKALDCAGVQVHRAKRIHALNADWAKLHTSIKDPKAYRSLSHLIGFLDERNIGPDKVTAQDLKNFEANILGNFIGNDPRGRIRRAFTAWEEVRSTSTDGGWPDVPAPALAPVRLPYILKFDDLPQTLRDEIDANIIRRANPDPFDDHELTPIRPDTVNFKYQYFRTWVTGAVKSGIPLERMTSIDALLDISIVKHAIKFFNARGLEGTVRDLSKHIFTVARETLGKDDPRATEIGTITKKQRKPRIGLTEQNRERLEPFKDPAIQQRLYGLPLRLKHKAKQHKSPKKAAALMRTAAILAICSICPLRVRTLTALRMDTHFVMDGNGKLARIYIPGSDMKTGEDMEFPVPEDVAQILQTYVQEYRPSFEGATGPHLFVTEAEQASRATIGGWIKRTIAKELGLTVNVHLLRHIAALVFLHHNPGQYETVRRLLGHKQLSTTLNYYAGAEKDAAFGAYHRLIGGIIDPDAL